MRRLIRCWTYRGRAGCGGRIGIYDAYESQVTLFAVAGLAEGSHTLEVTVVGQNSSARSSSYAAVDAVEIGTPSRPLPSLRYPAARKETRTIRFAAGFIAIAIFGPYMVGGLRTEQAAIYVVAAASVALLHHSRLTGAWVGVVSVWATLFTFATVAAIDPPGSSIPYGSLTAGLDNLALPLAALTCAAVMASFDREASLKVFASVICYGLVANSVVVVLSLLIDLRPILQAFWSAGDLEAVAIRAASNARHSGIFNQPAEAGLAYSIGGILAVWRWAWHESRQRRLAVVLTLLVLGGLLSVSKVFALIGLPVLVAALLRQRYRRARRAVLTGGGIAVTAGLLLSGVVPWTGQQRLENLLLGGGSSRDGTLLTFLTAGRFGEDSTLVAAASIVAGEAPLSGFGAQGLRMAYDSAWLEGFTVAGAIGVGLLSVVLVLLMVRAAHMRGRVIRDRWWLGVTVLAIAVLASFGVPAFTANRAGTMFWMLMGLTLLAPITDDAGGNKSTA